MTVVVNKRPISFHLNRFISIAKILGAEGDHATVDGWAKEEGVWAKKEGVQAKKWRRMHPVGKE